MRLSFAGSNGVPDGLAFGVGDTVLALRIVVTAQHSDVQWFQRQEGILGQRNDVVCGQVGGRATGRGAEGLFTSQPYR